MQGLEHGSIDIYSRLESLLFTWCRTAGDNTLVCIHRQHGRKQQRCSPVWPLVEVVGELCHLRRGIQSVYR